VSGVPPFGVVVSLMPWQRARAGGGDVHGPAMAAAAAGVHRTGRLALGVTPARPA
jgi:hypothetical protein